MMRMKGCEVRHEVCFVLELEEGGGGAAMDVVFCCEMGESGEGVGVGIATAYI